MHFGEKNPKSLCFFGGKMNIGISGPFFVSVYSTLAGKFRQTHFIPKTSFHVQIPLREASKWKCYPGESPFKRAGKCAFLPFSAVKKSTSGKKATPPYPLPYPFMATTGGGGLIRWVERSGERADNLGQSQCGLPLSFPVGFISPLLCCVGRVCMWAGDRGDQSAAENDQDSIVVVSRYI